MSDWLHNLPVVWMALVVFGFTYWSRRQSMQSSRSSRWASERAHSRQSPPVCCRR